MSSSLKSNFAVHSKYEAFYTGGKIQLSTDGAHMFCGCGNKVEILDVQTGRVIQSIGQEQEEEITSFVLSPDDKILVLASKNLIFRQWDWQENVLSRSWKAIHVGPVACMSFDTTSTLLASGSSDGTVKVWDVIRQYCTHNLRGHTGVISVVQFHPDISRLQLISASEDCKIRVWDLENSLCLAVLESHYSVVTSLAFSQSGDTLISSGRDSVMTVWNLTNYTLTKTVPVFETVESLFILPEDETFPDFNITTAGLFCVTAGNKGKLRIWNPLTSQCIYEQSDVIPTSKSGEGEQEQIITQALLTTATRTITLVTYDHNILQFSLDNFSQQKQFVGNNDEVLDIQFLGPNDSHIVVATNSEQLKIFELDTWHCQILYGHTDIILSVQVYRKTADMFVSSSKDNTIRLWSFDTSTKRARCIAVGVGHTHAVGTVNFSVSSLSFIVSGSKDCTLKMWPIPPSLDHSTCTQLHSRVTERAHDKDINSVVVAPNDKLIATGSQDRTAKLWTSDLSLVGVMRGHKRGIWSVQFSPVDQCLASASADGTIKIWSLSDFSCVKTFEGHDSSVLSVSFLSRGMQLISSGSDGLIKLWTIKTNECVKTLDEHEDKAWSLIVDKREERLVSGGADSTIIIWKDVTKSEQEEARAKQEEFILQNQELSNLIQDKKYLKAIGLAINLEQPFRVLNILKEIMADKEGKVELEKTLAKLRQDQLDAVLRFASQWNTNSKHCHVAQYVLSVILKTVTPDVLMKYPSMKSIIEGFLPYTDRHYQRLSRLSQQAMFVEYTWSCMKRVTDMSSSAMPAVTDCVEISYTEAEKPMESETQAPVEESQEDIAVRIRKAAKLYNWGAQTAKEQVSPVKAADAPNSNHDNSDADLETANIGEITQSDAPGETIRMETSMEETQKTETELTAELSESYTKVKKKKLRNHRDIVSDENLVEAVKGKFEKKKRWTDNAEDSAVTTMTRIKHKRKAKIS